MSYDFKKADAELKRKLGDDDYCVLGTSYEMADVLIQEHIIDGTNHLYSDHECLEALELGAAILKFMNYAAALEQRLFLTHAVNAPMRFDLVQNTAELVEIERLIASEKMQAAVIEGAHSVRH